MPKELRNLVIKLYTDKTELKGVEEKVNLYNASKALINAVYGMMAQDPVKFDIIFNETNEKLKEIDELPDLIKFMTKYMGEEDSEFNVIIVDNEKIHEINKTYRNIDRETDVISFALNDDETCNSFVRVLGDIYISIDKAKSQAEEYGHSLKRELSFLTVHGFLHLLGYDHMEKEDEIKMFSLQNEILKEYGVNR